MNEKFYSLKKDKQDTMINGAMQIFAMSGYRHASTDDMVKASGVSKGLWFHYFDTKTGLYSFVASYSLKYAMLEYSMCSVGEDEDYFDVRMKLEGMKMRMTDKYPYLPLFIQSVLNEEDPDALPEINDVRDLYNEQVGILLGKADYSKLKNCKDYLLLTDMLDNTAGALLEKGYRSGTFTKESYLREFQKYADALKAVVMKSSEKDDV